MLTNHQLISLASRMRVPLEGVYFKSQLKDMKMKPNRSYIINLEDEYDSDGNENDGSHYTAFQYNKYDGEDDKVVYFDSYGVAAPDEVCKFCKVEEIPYNTKDIQSLMADFCGWACLAWLHYINAFEGRTKCLYSDCEGFTDLFHDLNVETDAKYNEFVLKLFFRSPDDKRPINAEMVGFKWIPDENAGGSVADGIADINTIDSKE